MTRYTLRGCLRLAGVALGAVGAVLALLLFVSASGPTRGDGFVAGLAIGVAILLGTASLLVLSGSLSVPVASDEVGGALLGLSTWQRRLALTSFLAFCASVAVPGVMVTALRDRFAEPLVAALSFWVVVAGVAVLALLAALCWRAGAEVRRAVAARR